MTDRVALNPFSIASAKRLLLGNMFVFASPFAGRVVVCCLAVLLFATQGLAAPAAGTAAAPAKPAAGPDVRIEVAEDGTLRLDQTTNIAYADKGVVIIHGPVRLLADHARYNTVTHDLWAEGHVHLYDKTAQWTGEHLYYNFETGQTIMDKSCAFNYPWFIHGDHIEKVGSKYVVKNGVLTTCDYPEPHWGMYARTMDFYPGDKVLAHNVKLRIDDRSVFYLPWMSRSLKNERQGFEVEPGSDGRFGFYLLTAYNWYLNESLSGDYRADYRQKRGLAGGVDLHYMDKKWGQGKLITYFAHDTSPNSQSWHNPYETVPTDRYRVTWQDQTPLREDITFKANINKQSDSRVIEDFYRDEFSHQAQPQSTIELEKYDPGYMMSFWARPPVNSLYTMTEQIPAFAVDVKRQQLFGSPVYYDGLLTVEHLQRHFSNIDSNSFINPLVPGSGVPNDYNVTRFDWLNQISFPQMYFGWLSVIPRAGARETWYSSSPLGYAASAGGPYSPIGAGPQQTRMTFPMGVESSFKLSNVYDINDPFWDVHGVRHIIQPTLETAYTPSPDTSPNQLYQFDSTSRYDPNMATTRLRTLDPVANEQIDALDRQEVVRVGLRNKLQTKRDGQTEDFVNANIYAEYRGTTYPFIASDGTIKTRSDVSDAYSEVEARPFRWLAFDFNSRVSPNGELLEANSSIRFLQERKWEIALSRTYVEDVDHLYGGNSDYYTFSAHIAITENWAVRALYGMDTAVNRTFVQQYSLIRDLHDWEVSLNLSNYEFGNGVSEYNIYVACTLKTMPGLRVRAGR